MSFVDQLLEDNPAIHGDEEAGQQRLTHGLSTPALRFLELLMTPEMRTLETGAGFSTITITAAGADHTSVIPNPFEGDRIRAYCEQRGISTERLTFCFEPSERVLPQLDPEPLDLVLIDGSHSFPHTFIDWFYTAHRLRPGGHMLVDDIHIWSGRVLRDYLREDPDWRFEDEYLGRTARFTKLRETDPNVLWTDQAPVLKWSRMRTVPVRQAVSMVRHGQAGELVERVRSRLGR